MQISKKRIITIAAIALISTIIIVVFVNLKNVHLKFYNKTGEDIDSLVVGETYIGKVKKDNSTKFIGFKKLMFDNGIPYDKITGIIKDKKYVKLSRSQCGSGRQIVSEGEFVFHIELWTGKDGITYLNLLNVY